LQCEASSLAVSNLCAEDQSALEPITLTPQEYKRLRLQARRSIGGVAERIQYVLLFSRGYTPEQIADLY
jgi:hypothetical protein